MDNLEESSAVDVRLPKVDLQSVPDAEALEMLALQTPSKDQHFVQQGNVVNHIPK
jgi:hypothetical protein